MVVVERHESPDPELNKEPTFDDVPEQSWFNEMVNVKKDPLAFDDVMGSIIDFSKFTKNCLKKDKITKAGLEGPAFKLLKGKHINYIELEYNFQQCYLALTNQLDWINLEGDRILRDLSKPQPCTVHQEYATSLTKPKAARYDLEGIEAIEFIQDEQTDLVTAFWFFIQRIVIEKRFKDVQLGMESYQTNLNIKIPQLRCVGLDIKEPYTMISLSEQGQQKFLIRADELYKLGDGTLKKVRDKIDYMLHNFELGYNNGMPKRAWTDKDKKFTASMLEKIKKTLLTRRIMRSLECLWVEEESRRTTDF
uniref:Uncharacterized protein n=1 Tax=Tanacetum cinerariifolium TaxID=118510 RepID=A0A6L2LME8_TANCI|nr:hypothetical protein [Tanacetum cinerariifolium]